MEESQSTTTDEPVEAREQADSSASPSTTSKPAAKNRIPKWQSEAHASIKTALSRYRKPLADLVKRDANEGDTRLLVTDFLCDALGYDKYEDLSTEYMVRGEFADYVIRIDQQLTAFIEVKRAAQKLNRRHLRQVETYVVKEGLEWCVLTNGQVWQVYHVAAGTGQKVETTLVFEVDLLGDESTASKTEQLFHLHRSALKRNTVSAVWQHQAATSPDSLTAVLLSDGVIDPIRKEIRRQSGYNPDPDDLVSTLRAGVIRPELV